MRRRMSKNQITGLVEGYRVVLEPDLEDGGYVVSCPALRRCHSQGDTRDEALTNIQDAIQGYLASLRGRNLPIPEPGSTKL